MKINFLGDSITYGAGVDNPADRYSTLVAKYFCAEECNYGVGGTRIAVQRNCVNDYDENVFMRRAVQMEKNVDFTFVFGGTNDYGHGDAKLGCFDDRDVYTFYGAFHELVAYLVASFPKGRLCFILPIPRYNQDDPRGEDGGKQELAAPLSSYIEAEKEVLAYYGVEYLDLSNSFYVPSAPNRSKLFLDGLHLNAAGHKFLADRLIAYLENKNFDNL